MKKFSKIFVLIFAIFTCIWIWNSADLNISNITLANWWGNTIAEWGTPDIYVTVVNNWSNAFNQWIPENYVSCTYQGYFIGGSQNFSQLYIPSHSTYNILVSLDKKLTTTGRPVSIVCHLNNNLQTSHTFNLNITTWWNHSDNSMSQYLSSIRKHLDASEPNSLMWWWVTVKNFIFNLISNILVPIIVLAGIILWIIWWYQIITSDKPETMKKWILNVVFWIVWIIFILSAKYIWTIIFDIFGEWNMQEIWDLNSITLASQLYTRIAYPFIKIAIYLVLWVMFLILAGKTVSIVTSGDIKKAWTIIAWTAISILTIIGAKQIVEAVYWKQAEVLRTTWLNNIWEIWSWIFADKNIPIIYDVINWVLWITAIIILILIIVHTFKILTNPSKTDNWKSLWKSLLYIFIWIMIIWVGYIITNLLIIN